MLHISEADLAKDVRSIVQLVQTGTEVTRHQRRGWVISNSNNPSTKRLLGSKVKRVEGHEAVAATTEYWYLRW